MNIKTKYITGKALFILFSFLIISCNNENSEDPKNNIAQDKIRVVVFNGNGASNVCQIETYEALKIDSDIIADYISAAEIVSGKLNDFDVIVFPGGSGSQELNNLGQIGAKKVIEFVNAGHGAVGICAGGYLFSTTKDYPSLQLVSATEWDREHYDKGRALVEFELTADGENIFPELIGKKSFLQYSDGPVFMPADSNINNIFKYSELAKFVTDIQIHEDYPGGVTPGKTFLLSDNVAKGKTMVVAGHPESTPGMRWMVPRMARWAANKPIIEYSPKWVRPELYNHAILFNKELRKIEKEAFWSLFSSNKVEIIDAMQILWELHSRPAVRWNMGMLRDTIPEVRAKAAELLMQAEYTAALEDIKNAYSIESDSITKSTLKVAIEFLSEY